jgi:hypothetical protein
MATQPGDGKSSPFGNGKGSGAMAKQTPKNLVQTGRGSDGGAKPRDMTKDQAAPKSTGEGPNPESVPAGGDQVKADPPAASDVHPVGKAPKPFKLGA